jgi:hypothetical protein
MESERLSTAARAVTLSLSKGAAGAFGIKPYAAMLRQAQHDNPPSLRGAKNERRGNRSEAEFRRSQSHAMTI